MPIGNEEGGQTSLGDMVIDSQYQSFQLAQEDKIRLQQALAQLEEHTQQMLEFVFLKDLTHQETARQMGVSVVTVSRRIKAGIARLKSALT
jgi:RNA polymerase sigma-B factor